MKKIIIGMVLVSSLVGCSNDNIVTSHGFKVVDDGDNKDNKTKIIAKITDTDSDNDGYVIATNLHDKEDTVAIDKKDYNKGDVVIIEFEDDDVVSVIRRDW